MRDLFAILLFVSIQVGGAQDHGRVDYSVPVGYFPAGIAVDGAGAAYVAQSGDNRLLKFALDGSEVRRFDFGEVLNGGLSDVAVAPDGKVFVAGRTEDGAFPVSADAFQAACPVTGVFVARLDAGLEGIEAATFLCGSGTDTVADLEIGQDGSVLLTGWTDSADFPVTDGAIRERQELAEAYVTVLRSDLREPVFSTYIGGNSVDYGSSIAADSAGNVYITAASWSDDFPVTPGAYVGKGAPSDRAFVTKIAADGSEIIYSAALDVSSFMDRGNGIAVDGQGRAWVAAMVADNPILQDGLVARLSADGARMEVLLEMVGQTRVVFRDIAMHPEGGVVVAGTTSTPNMPVTADAQQPCMANPLVSLNPGWDVMYARLSEDGELVHSSFLGGSGMESFDGLAVDGGGNVYVAALTASRDYPFTVEPNETNPLAFQSGSITKIAFDGTGPRVTCMVHGAALARTKVSPGQIVTLYGEGLGPEKGLTGDPGGTGSVPTTLGGTTVRFEGIAAPLLWVQDRQVNAVVPFGVAESKVALVEVVSGRGPLPPFRIEVVEMTPAIFPVVYGEDIYGAVLNQNFTVNSPSNPARRGEIVMFFASGGGLLTPQPLDGEILSGPAYPDLAGPVAVKFDSARWFGEVTYAGAAPGFVAGAIQINTRIPEDLEQAEKHYVEVSASEVHGYPEIFRHRTLIAIE